MRKPRSLVRFSVICTNSAPESTQPLPLQSFRCRHRTVVPNGRKWSVDLGYADLSRAPRDRRRLRLLTTIRQFVDHVLDIASRRSSRTRPRSRKLRIHRERRGTTRARDRLTLVRHVVDLEIEPRPWSRLLERRHLLSQREVFDHQLAGLTIITPHRHTLPVIADQVAWAPPTRMPRPPRRRGRPPPSVQSAASAMTRPAANARTTGLG